MASTGWPTVSEPTEEFEFSTLTGAVGRAEQGKALLYNRAQQSGWHRMRFDHTYKGLRPSWAGPVYVWYDEVQVEPDLPGFSYSKPGTIARPRAVLGTILGSKSIGRGAAQVFGADLVYSQWDRGHLMAVSLGGPDSPYATIPQPRLANQKLEDEDWSETFYVGQPSSWRAMELYLLGISTLLLQGDYDAFRKVVFGNPFKKVWRSKSTVGVASNLGGGIATYAANTVLQKDSTGWILVYYAEPNYTDHWPGNIADKVYVDVVAYSSNSTVQILEQDCLWEEKAVDLPFDSARSYTERINEIYGERRERARQAREEIRERERQQELAALSLTGQRRTRATDFPADWMDFSDTSEDDDYMG